MAINSQAESDCITSTTQITIDATKRIAPGEMPAVLAAFQRTILSTDFFGKMAAIEPSLAKAAKSKRVPKYGSRAYYARAILDTMNRVRAAIRRATELGVSGAPEASSGRAWVNNALAGAARIGYLAAESNAKGWPALQLGLATPAEWSRGGRVGSENRRKTRDGIVAAVEALRNGRLTRSAAALAYLAKNDTQWNIATESERKQKHAALLRRITRANQSSRPTQKKRRR